MKKYLSIADLIWQNWLIRIDSFLIFHFIEGNSKSKAEWYVQTDMGSFAIIPRRAHSNNNINSNIESSSPDKWLSPSQHNARNRYGKTRWLSLPEQLLKTHWRDCQLIKRQTDSETKGTLTLWYIHQGCKICLYPF